jgi:hypothetical protein
MPSRASGEAELVDDGADEAISTASKRDAGVFFCEDMGLGPIV